MTRGRYSKRRTITLTQEDDASLRKQASEAGMSVSEFVRSKSLLSGVAPPADEPPAGPAQSATSLPVYHVDDMGNDGFRPDGLRSLDR